MTPTLDLKNGNTLVVSPTQLGAMMTCRSYWHYNYMWRRVRAGVFPARDGGKAADRALNKRYELVGNKAAGANDATELAMCREIDDTYKDVELPEDEYRTPTRYKDVIKAYNAHWQHEPFEVLAVQKHLEGVELGVLAIAPGTSFDNGASIYPHDSLRVEIHGVLDLLTRWDDGVWVMDTKTMNKWGDTQLTTFKNSGQAKAYCWMVGEEARQRGLGDVELVKGIILNGIVIRAPVKTKRRNGDPDNEFHRVRFNYSQERLEEWRRDALREVEMSVEAVARGHYTQNDKMCAMMYGKPCPYLEVCAAPREQRALVLSMDVFKDYEKLVMSDAVASNEVTI